MRLAVLVSGSGSLLAAMVDEALPIQLVIADRPCAGLELGGDEVPSVLVERTRWGASFDRDDYTDRLLAVLAEHEIDLVAMAGFGTVLGPAIFTAFEDRIINTHPALLPSFPGWHAVRDALDLGVKVTGCTIHVATPEVDAGPILAQGVVEVLDDDDEASLHERIKVVERDLYVETLGEILARGFVLTPNLER